MVQSGVVANVVKAQRGATFEIGSTDDHARHPGRDHCAGAHRARLQGHHQRASVQTPSTNHGCCVAQGQYFGVGGGISGEFALVVAGSDHLAAAKHNRAHRDIAMSERRTGFVEGLTHGRGEILVSGSVSWFHRRHGSPATGNCAGDNAARPP